MVLAVGIDSDQLTTLGVGAVFALFGLAAMAYGVRMHSKAQRFKLRARSQKATVVAYERRRTNSGDDGPDYVYHPVVELEQRGVTQRLTSRTGYGGSIQKRFPVGGETDIYYLPEELDNFELYRRRSGPGLWAFLIAGTPFLAIGIYVMYTGFTM